MTEFVLAMLEKGISDDPSGFAGTFEISSPEATVLVAIVTGIFAVIAQRITARNEREASMFERMREWTEGQLEQRDERIEDLEEEVKVVRSESATWKNLLITSVDHIIDLHRVWPGDDEIPATPADLDGIIIDRSYSRRVVDGTKEAD